MSAPSQNDLIRQLFEVRSVAGESRNFCRLDGCNHQGYQLTTSPSTLGDHLKARHRDHPRVQSIFSETHRHTHAERIEAFMVLTADVQHPGAIRVRQQAGHMLHPQSLNTQVVIGSPIPATLSAGADGMRSIFVHFKGPRGLEGRPFLIQVRELENPCHLFPRILHGFLYYNPEGSDTAHELRRCCEELKKLTASAVLSHRSHTFVWRWTDAALQRYDEYHLCAYPLQYRPTLKWKVLSIDSGREVPPMQQIDDEVKQPLGAEMDTASNQSSPFQRPSDDFVTDDWLPNEEFSNMNDFEQLSSLQQEVISLLQRVKDEHHRVLLLQGLDALYGRSQAPFTEPSLASVTATAAATGVGAAPHGTTVSKLAEQRAVIDAAVPRPTQAGVREEAHAFTPLLNVGVCLELLSTLNSQADAQMLCWLAFQQLQVIFVAPDDVNTTLIEEECALLHSMQEQLRLARPAELLQVRSSMTSSTDATLRIQRFFVQLLVCIKRLHASRTHLSTHLRLMLHTQRATSPSPVGLLVTTLVGLIPWNATHETAATSRVPSMPSSSVDAGGLEARWVAQLLAPLPANPMETVERWLNELLALSHSSRLIELGVQELTVRPGGREQDIRRCQTQLTAACESDFAAQQTMERFLQMLREAQPLPRS